MPRPVPRMGATKPAQATNWEAARNTIYMKIRNEDRVAAGCP